MLDYELELAAVIGSDGGIEGFTIMNDWSARDLQVKEMSVGLGPAKGKDFATSLGPELVSPDELPADLDMRAIARVNGEVRTDTRTGAHALVLGPDRRGGRPQHAGPAGGRRARLGHRRRRLHPRARRRSLARSRATRSSWRSRGSACCAIGWSAMSGELSFFEIGVGDADKARAFYGALFDWGFDGAAVGTRGDDRHPATSPVACTAATRVAGLYVFFAVDDIDAAAERVRELGGEAEPLPGGDDATRRRQVRPLHALPRRPGLELRPAPAACLGPAQP